MSLELFGPLGHKLQEQGQLLDERFCEVKSILERIAQNSRAESMRNNWVHKYIRGDANAEGADNTASIFNDTGYGWLVHWIATDQNVEVFRGAVHPSNFLWLGLAGASDLVHWYIPDKTNVTVKDDSGFTGYVTLQVEQISIVGAAVAANASGELYEVTRPADPVPSAEVGINGR